MKMTNIPSGSPKTYTAKYLSFRGVDMSGDATKIDNSRSPFAPNLISVDDAFPECRPGWRTLHTIESPVNGLFRAVIDGVDTWIAHGGTKLYTWTQDAAPVVIKENVNNARSTAFSMGGKLWILTGLQYLVYGKFDGALTVKNVSEIAYVPTTIISRLPAGGGTMYENVNLLTPKRKNSFLADGTAVKYQLDSGSLTSVDQVTVNDVVKTVNTDYTVDLTAGTVTFKTAPPAPTVEGADNVMITFRKTITGYADKVQKCKFNALYGVGTNDRAFISGNPDSPSTDWYSGLNDPSYFPDLGYSNVGTDGTAIMGYLRLGEYLAIVKEDNQQDSTIFLRSASVNDAGEPVFPLKQGVAGVGAISKYCFANLKDEPLFLSRTGVYAVTSNLVTAERTVRNRSYYVDPKLTREENLKDAVCTEWNGKYLVCVNSRCYILDGNQNKSTRSGGDFVYECYHWENIPAVCFMEHEGDLFFGTADGRICRFNTDIATMSRYNDDGAPIVCYWSTKADDDGDFMSLKTIPKKGSGIMLKPYTRSSVQVVVRTNKDFGRELRYSTMDIFDWNDIDFNRFTFNTNDAPQVVPFNAKVKKYITAQIIVKNEVLNEGFGVLGIIKRYQVIKLVK